MLDVDVEENVEAVVIVEFDDMLLVCVWARAKDPETIDKRARATKAMVMRPRMLILLPKPATFTPN
jgi:peroxiredoxin